MWRWRRSNATTRAPPLLRRRPRPATSAIHLAADEGLEPGAAGGVLHLLGRGLHEVRRRGQDRATDATVLGDLHRAERVDADAGRVRGVPDLELVLHVHRHLADSADLE